jgi:bidirectional [NiFe] hydrogenase diaphorase subunit
VFDADPRFELIDAAMKRLQHCPDSLIAILHQAQDQFGYLDAAVLAPIARSLMLPPSRVYGVATFYHLFSTEPPGEHTCVVCLGTACFVQGASKLLERAEAVTGCKAGGTTPDGKISLRTARCLGVSGCAPVVVYDGTILVKQSAEDVENRLKGWVAYGAK